MNNFFQKIFYRAISEMPRYRDVAIMSFFTILITVQPFFLYQEIIMLDTGNHLPAINALLHGKAIYKDFLFWRGPLELYVPALMMKIWGPETALLSTFFYVGSVLTLVAGIFLAWQILRTRLFFYLMVPVFVARTFPRVSYYYWGGFRYLIGFLALFCAIYGFKKKRLLWIFLAGVVSCLCWFTTIEAGVSAILAITFAMAVSFAWKAMDRKFLVKSFKYFSLGFFIVFIPYIGYLAISGSLAGYIDTTITVPKFLTTLMDARSQYPETFWQFLYFLIPGTKFFRFMTPFYCHVTIFVYLCYRIRKNRLDWEIPALTILSVYGIILFFASFRMIEGHHFEMALQPEKILLFFLLERIYISLRSPCDVAVARVSERQFFGVGQFRVSSKVYLARLFIFIVIVSSIGYSIQRFNNRFTIFKTIRNSIQQKGIDQLKPLYGQEIRTLKIERVNNMTVPRWQADEIEGVVKFLKENTGPNEAIFCFPEVGNFAFWVDRPLVSRFGIGTASWVDEKWHRELVDSFEKGRPQYVVMTHVGHKTFPAAIYFKYPENIRKFKEVTKLVLDNYEPVKNFDSVAIYKLKEKSKKEFIK